MARSTLLSKSRALLVAAPVFGLILLFQNCAPALLAGDPLATLGTESDVPMSKVVVHLQHADGAVLSDVDLVADDVMTTIDNVDSNAQATALKRAPPKKEPFAVDDPSSFSLELPLGERKIIVARAKLLDPATGVVSSVYGNAVVTVDESLGSVTIDLITIQ